MKPSEVCLMFEFNNNSMIIWLNLRTIWCYWLVVLNSASKNHILNLLLTRLSNKHQALIGFFTIRRSYANFFHAFLSISQKMLWIPLTSYRNILRCKSVDWFQSDIDWFLYWCLYDGRGFANIFLGIAKWCENKWVCIFCLVSTEDQWVDIDLVVFC